MKSGCGDTRHILYNQGAGNLKPSRSRVVEQSEWRPLMQSHSGLSASWLPGQRNISPSVPICAQRTEIGNMNNVCRQAEDTLVRTFFFFYLVARPQAKSREEKPEEKNPLSVGRPEFDWVSPYAQPYAHSYAHQHACMWAWQRPKATFSVHLLCERQSFLMSAHILAPTQDYLHCATGRIRVIK